MIYIIYIEGKKSIELIGEIYLITFQLHNALRMKTNNRKDIANNID